LTVAIGVSGKGGTGKTTFAALIVEYLTDKGLKPVLAVDADPNSNLDLVLGVGLPTTIGAVREDMTEKTKKSLLPAGMSKQELLEMQVEQALVETKDFDLISMGRQEGPGCYCAINNMLRVFIDRLEEHYEYVVIDNEAGMEHLSRRTTRALDVLFVVSDPSRRGLETASRISGLAHEMQLEVGQERLVVSRVRGSLAEPLVKAAEETGMELAGTIPEDEEITALEAEGKPLRGLRADSEARLATRAIMESVLQGVKG
jgi:CO dehydrogenase maturation factor